MRLLTKKQVRDKVTYSLTHIDRLEAEGKFPQRIRLGQQRVAWCEAEIDDWIKARIEARDKPTP
ncbi:MAG: helix-turn-helix transcriptional regulator [Paracoccaceae bacterium]